MHGVFRCCRPSRVPSRKPGYGQVGAQSRQAHGRRRPSASYTVERLWFNNVPGAPGPRDGVAGQTRDALVNTITANGGIY
ncbi:hypothetical protein BC936DRAFT_139428 [Jimgerdemannia flammicorona]|uniref:Uncharacterized protein n=1 Tax=Jimgerdemannia flammicorona TaxID=994334 RepID=A0A433DHQ8_9FUNG|nr:hypothetical protein BC936DRAFT_139428 [Jimgerdemannia flammicorona]